MKSLKLLVILFCGFGVFCFLCCGILGRNPSSNTGNTVQSNKNNLSQAIPPLIEIQSNATTIEQRILELKSEIELKISEEIQKEIDNAPLMLPDDLKKWKAEKDASKAERVQNELEKRKATDPQINKLEQQIQKEKARKKSEEDSKRNERDAELARIENADLDYPVSGNTPKDETRKLRVKIGAALGKKAGASFTINDYYDNTTQKVIQVHFRISDNLTEGFIKSGARRDIADILKAVDESGISCYEVTVFGSFPLVDKFGNSSSVVVTKATYKGSTISKINWRNFLKENIYDIADEHWLHPTFRD